MLPDPVNFVGAVTTAAVSNKTSPKKLHGLVHDSNMKPPSSPTEHPRSDLFVRVEEIKETAQGLRGAEVH